MSNNGQRSLNLVPEKVRPPLKWAGSKFRIIEAIRARLPEGRRLVEPFVGSGAVFLNTDYERYLINDINNNLAQFYRALKDNGESFIAYCKPLFTPTHNKEIAYYDLRAEFNTTTDAKRKAALFLYLNKHGYNGLCRYNSSGAMNVPFGRYKQPYFPEKEMRFLLGRVKRLKIESRDFAAVMRSTRAGDVIYCDPPYVPLSTTAYFTSYSAGGFTLEDQQRLAGMAEETAQRGVPVLISNHDTPFTESIYQKASLTKLSVRRFISCNSSKREHAAELLALYAPLSG